MFANLKFQKLAALLTASVMTLIVYAWDRQSAQSRSVEKALGWARQAAVQAEALALVGREKAENDPVRWAANLLTQGPEGKSFRFQKVLGLSSAQPEVYAYQADLGVFEYSKLIGPEDGSGVKVTLPVEKSLSFGESSQVASDLLFLAVFLCCFMFCSAALTKFSKKKEKITLDELKVEVRQWAAQAKELLLQLANHLRNTVREAHSLALQVAESRKNVSTLRDRIHTGINQIRAGKASLQTAARASAQTEVIALNVVLEASRLGEPGKSLGKMAEELHLRVQRLKKLIEDGEDAASQIELCIEPMATDADIAFHAYADVGKTTEALDSHIRSTTQAMLAQSKIMQRPELGSADSDEITNTQPLLAAIK